MRPTTVPQADLILTLTFGLAAAFVFGFVTQRLPFSHHRISAGSRPPLP